MSKKINKHLRKELANVNANLAIVQIEKKTKEKEVEYYKKRFRDLGSITETEDEFTGGRLVVEKFTADIIPFGGYCYIEDRDRYNGGDEIAQQHLVRNMVEALIEKNLVQFIYQRDPFNGVVKIGAKLFVVPWDQTPHRKTIELLQLVNDIMKEKP